MAGTRKKLLLAAAAIGGLLVLAVVAVLFTDFDSPELGRLALARIGESSGLDLRAEGFRLHLLRGLELEKVEARGPIDGGEIEATMDRLVLKHRPGDLLGGRLTVTELVLDRPRVELETAGAGDDDAPSSPETPSGEPASPEAAADQQGTSLDLSVSTIRLVDGSLVQRTPAETTEIRGLDVELHDLSFGAAPGGGSPAGRGEVRVDEIVTAATGGAEAETTTVRGLGLEIHELAFDPADAARLAGASLRGEVRIEQIVSGETEARDTRGQVELAGGRFLLDDLRLTAPQGELTGRLDADVTGDPLTYTLRLDGEALSTGVILGLGETEALGTSRFELSAAGTGSDLAQVLGEGRLTVGGGTLPDHPVLVQVQRILGNVVLVGTGYDSFPLEFDIRSNRVHLARCELSAGPVSLALSGWVDFDGPLELELSVLAPRQGLRIEELPAEILDALAEDDGRVNLPMLVRGTSELASVALNRDFLKRQGKKYVQKTVERELGKALSGLFGKKKDDG